MIDNVGIAELVRQMRARLNLTQTEFAKLLRCAQNSVSHYESGESTPVLGVMLRMYDLGLPSERQLLEGQIKKSLSSNGKFYSADAPVKALRGMIEDTATEEAFLRNIPPNLREKWQPFIEIIARIVSTDRTLDDSIIEMIQIWEANSGNYEIKRLLRDAVGYLRAGLSR